MVFLPSGDFDQHSQRVLHTLQLIRLGSEVLVETCSIPPAAANSHAARSRVQTLVENGSHPRMHPVLIRQKRTTEDGRYMCKTAENFGDSLLSSSLPVSPHPFASDKSKLLSASSSFSASDCLVRCAGERHENGSNPHGMLRNELRSGTKFQVDVEVYNDDVSISNPASGTVSLDTDYLTTSKDAAETFQTDTESTVEAGSTDLERTLTTADPEVQTLSRIQPEKLAFRSSGINDATSTEGGGGWRESRGEAEAPEERERLEQEDESHSWLTIGTQGLLSEDYVRELEHNFVQNHLFGESTQPVTQAAEDIIRVTQVSLL